MAYLIFIFLCMIWGTNFILMKKASLWFEPTSVGVLRTVSAVVLLAVVQFCIGRPWPFVRKDFGALLFVAVLGYAFPFTLQPVLIERCGSGFIGLMVSFVPLLTILVSIPMLGVYPTKRQFVGVVGGLLFLTLILVDRIDRQVTVVDVALATTVPLVYAIANTFIRRRFANFEPLPIALGSLCIAMFLTAPYIASNPVAEHAKPTDQWLAIGSVLLLGLLGTGFGALAFTKLLQDRGPLFAGMVTYLIPTFALTWGWVDNEPVTAVQVMSLVGVLAMVAIVQFGSAPRIAPADA